MRCLLQEGNCKAADCPEHGLSQCKRIENTMSTTPGHTCSGCRTPEACARPPTAHCFKPDRSYGRYDQVRSLASWLDDEKTVAGDEFRPIAPMTNWMVRISDGGYPLLMTPDLTHTVWTLSAEAAPRLPELRTPCKLQLPDLTKITAQCALDLGLLVRRSP